MKLDSLSHDTKDVETSEPNQSLEETKDPSLACEPGVHGLFYLLYIMVYF